MEARRSRRHVAKLIKHFGTTPRSVPRRGHCMSLVAKGFTAVMAQRREPPDALDYFPTPRRLHQSRRRAAHGETARGWPKAVRRARAYGQRTVGSRRVDRNFVRLVRCGARARAAYRASSGYRPAVVRRSLAQTIGSASPLGPWPLPMRRCSPRAPLVLMQDAG